MENVMVNELCHDGMRRLRVVGDVEIEPGRYLCWVPVEARERAVVSAGRDDLLGLFSLELTYPIYEPFMVALHSPKKFRRLMFVHFSFANRVSECIALARTEFWGRTKFAPVYAFVKGVPKDLDGALVSDCIILEAEWMPARCAAVGGCDV